ncbi:MAG: hypothetical protein U0L94_03505 [Akkermansia sp.]|uniref:hypothetical protein n=1 Tax=Akkermansia sp. TaxID=1872421 RepID=UPI002E75C1F7|nr:hypothetical protein [Akkermansia sp.]MEE0763918.1 hypothetical protein [Akkermansia sp.]
MTTFSTNSSTFIVGLAYFGNNEDTENHWKCDIFYFRNNKKIVSPPPFQNNRKRLKNNACGFCFYKTARQTARH